MTPPRLRNPRPRSRPCCPRHIAERLGARAGQLALAILLLACWQPQAAEAQTVRGRVDLYNQSVGIRPAYGLQVVLFNPRMGQSSPAVTDMYGFYYFNNVPPGNYTMNIYSYGRQIRSLRIRVYGQPLTDIQPILIR